MKDRNPPTHPATTCPECERRAAELERSRENSWAEFLAELRRNFRYDASFDAILREAVLP